MESISVSTRGRSRKLADELDHQNPTMLDRLSKLSEASLRINESLDLDTVLQGVLDSARSLTGARYAGITTVDDAGQPKDFVTSGTTPEEHQALAETPDGPRFFEYLLGLSTPLRIRDMVSHFRSMGLPEFQSPVPARSFLATSLRNLGRTRGIIYLANGEGGPEFTAEDEETLVMFASQAALVIVNALRYQGEQRARADLQALVDVSPVGVLIFDGRTGDLLSMNPETRRIVRGHHAPGHSLPELLSVLTFRRPDGREIPPEELPTERAIRGRVPVRGEEIVIHLPDGQAVTTIVSAVPILSAEGDVVSVVATIQDMTPLENLERQRAEFLGIVSHELRTPLTMIKGSTATVLSGSSTLGPTDMRQLFKIIDEQADRMRDLINNLLDMTRIEVGMLSVTPEPISVADVVGEANRGFLPGRTRNSIDVEIPEGLPRIEADTQRIIQVLGNLISNASRNSPESSTITITVSQENFHVLFTVADEGRGISPEDLPHLFKKFSRIVGDSAGQDNEGTGIGLAICKGIVEAHGGRIWAESDGLGLGSRFMFTIPAVEEVVSVPANGAGQLTGDSGQTAPERVRILAVDDEPQILRHIRSTFSESGYEAVVTGDPREVEHLIEARKPHLVLVDLALPGTDGFALMKRISNITEAPVIFLSGRSEEQIIARALEMGAADYVVKPFSPTELVARARAALRKQAASQPPPSKPYELGELKISYTDRRVMVADQPVQLTGTEYKLLTELSTNAGRVLTHDQLLQRVWGFDYSGNPRLLQAFVKTLRRKLGDDAKSPSYIFTEFRVGYRMPKDNLIG